MPVFLFRDKKELFLGGDRMSQNENTLKELLKEGFTHGGVFHADDVFATALLKILNPNIHISRDFLYLRVFQGLCMILRGKYDHQSKTVECVKMGYLMQHLD